VSDMSSDRARWVLALAKRDPKRFVTALCIGEAIGSKPSVSPAVQLHPRESESSGGGASPPKSVERT